MTVIVPIHTTSEPDRCPECKEVENTKVVCAHCGHEYKKDACSFWRDDAPILGIIALVIWVSATVLIWLMNQDPVFNDGEAPPTLFEQFKRQWDFIKGLRIW